MSTSRTHAPVEHARASLTGLYITLAGVVIFNIAAFLTWASSSQDDDSFSGYEADSLVPFAAYLGLGLAVALLLAARKADRRQHRGLTLVSLAAGIAVTLQCVAWLVDVPGNAERSGELSADIGTWVGLVGALLWTIGSAMFANEPEGEIDHTRAATTPTSGYNTPADQGPGYIAGA